MAGQTTVLETLLVAIQDTIKVCTNAFGPQSALVHDLGDLTAALKDLSFLDTSFQKPTQGSDSQTLRDGSLREALFNCLDAVSKARRLARGIARGRCRESDIPRENFDKIKQFAVYFSGLVKLDPLFDGATTNNSSEDPYIGDRHQRSDPWRGELVLSLDGGGVRGFATLILLEELCNAIAKEESRDPQVLDSYSSPLFQTSRSTPRQEELAKYGPSAKRGPDAFRLCHYFDYICGSSFGGMAAVMLGVMRCTVGETIDHNRDIWRTKIHTTSKFLVPIPIPSLQLFNKARNSIDMRSSLQSTFEERTSMGEGADTASNGHMHRTAVTPTLSTLDGRCQTIVFAIQEASDGRVRPYAFRSYSLSPTEQLHSRSRSKPGIPDAGPNGSSVSVVDACLATSAVPSLYRKVKIPELEGSFVDGGVWRSNPAEEVYRELQIRHQSPRPPIRALLSIGGRPALQESRRQREPLARAIDRIGDLIHDEKSRFDDFLQVRQRNQELKYDRLLCETTTKPSVHIDRMLDSIEQEARAFVRTDQKTQQVLRSWAGFLVKTRQQRSRTARWAEYAGLKMPHVGRESSSTTSSLPISREENGIDSRLRSAVPVSVANDQ